MSQTGSAVRLYDQSGNPLDVTDGVAVPAGQSGLVVVGSDGANLRFLKTDASGRPILVGAGAAGAPVGGVASVQGVAGGTALPISAAALPLPAGAATEATLATRAAAATQTDGTQKAIARGGAKGATAAADLTSTAEGADHQALDVQIMSGGVAKDPTAIRALTAADVVTVVQAVYASLKAQVQLRNPGDTANLGDAANPVRTDPTGTTAQPVSQGAGAAAGAPWSVELSDGAAFYVGAKTGQLPAALVGGRLDENLGAWLGSTAPTVGQKVMASAVPVVIASDQTEYPVKQGSPNTLANAWPVLTLQGGKATFMASTNGVIASGTAAGTVTSIAYLIHTAASTKKVRIQRIWVSFSGNSGNNPFSLRGAFITAENGVPGGTAETINGTNRANAADGTDTFRAGATGAPARLAGDLVSLAGLTSSSMHSTLLYDAAQETEPLTLRLGVLEGFEVRHVVGGSNLAAAVNVAVTFEWSEE